MSPMFRSEDSRGPLPPLPPNLPRTWDQILLNDDFSGGIHGWHTHTGGYPPYLSDHSFQRSANALKLSNGPVQQSAIGGSNSIYKRLGETFQDGYLLFGGWFAFRGASEHAAPANVALSIDHQAFDDTGRSFGRLLLRRYVANDSGGEDFKPRWSLYPDQIPTTPPANVYVDIPSAGVSQFPAVAGSGAVPGWNTNHGDYWFAGLLMSCQSADNNGVGIGRYHRAYLGNAVFDLSVLLTNSQVTNDGGHTHSGVGTAPGSGAENPQTDVSSGGPNAASSFSGGLNVGLWINNRGTVVDTESALFAGHVFAAHYPVGTTFVTGSQG